MTSARTTSLVGMTVFLGSWAMTFTALMFSFGIVREASAWPPAELAALPWPLPAATVVVLAASSGAAEWGRRRDSAGLVAVAAALAVVFLALQARVWLVLSGSGLEVGDASASMIYALTGFHAVHATVGAAALWYLAASMWRRRAAGSAPLLWTLFWHFVGVAWLAIYLGVFAL